MWLETKDEEDIKRLGDSDEIISTKTDANGKKRIKPKFGDLRRYKDDDVYKYVSFRTAIEKLHSNSSLVEPELIASTEW